MIAAATHDAAQAAHPSAARTARPFLLLFALFAVTSIAPLVLGLAAVVVAHSPALHETATVWAAGEGLGARLASALAEYQGTRALGLVGLDYAVSALNVGFATFLMLRRPRDWVARLFAIGMVGTATAFNYDSHRAVIEGPGFLALHHLTLHAVAGAAYVHGILLFPDGRLRPPWTRWLLVAVYGAAVLALIGAGSVTPFAEQERARAITLLISLELLFFAWFFGLVIPLLGIATQGYRYWSGAAPAARQQSKLLMSALAVSLVLGLVYLSAAGGHALPLTWEALQRIEWDFPIIYFNFDPGEASVTREALERVEPPLFQVLAVLFAVIPVALFIAILRYRLWEMDLVVSRTLTYGLLTVMLGATYLALIFALQALLRPVTGGHDLAIVVTTLVVAALFLPARRRVQDAVDRRFNRRAYDAARTVEQFSARLRHEVDLDDLREDLLAVVEETMQPQWTSLWLRSVPGEEPARPARASGEPDRGIRRAGADRAG